MAKTVDATFHVQIEPEWSRYAGSDGERIVTGAKMVNATQSRPRGAMKPGTVLVKLTVRLPEGAFLPLRPEAIITIPAELIQTAPVEVTAETPDEEQS